MLFQMLFSPLLQTETMSALVTARLQHFTKRRKEKPLRLTIHLVEAGGNGNDLTFGIEQHDCPFHWTVNKVFLWQGAIANALH